MGAQFKNILRRLRKGAGLTQVQAASILDVAPGRVADWEQGGRTPKLLTQEAILARLRNGKQPTKGQSNKTAEFGRRLQQFRTRSGLRQADVAVILGVSTPRISNWECGVRTPKPLTQEGIWARLDKHMPKKRP